MKLWLQSQERRNALSRLAKGDPIVKSTYVTRSEGDERSQKEEKGGWLFITYHSQIEIIATSDTDESKNKKARKKI